MEVWKEKQIATQELFETIQDRISPWLQGKPQAVKAILKEVIQAGYRKADTTQDSITIDAGRSGKASDCGDVIQPTGTK